MSHFLTHVKNIVDIYIVQYDEQFIKNQKSQHYS